MIFREIKEALKNAALLSSGEAVQSICDEEVANEGALVPCDEISEFYREIARRSEVKKQAEEMKELVENLARHSGSSGHFIQFAAGPSGLDFMLYLHESGAILGCIRTGVVGNA